MPYSAELRNELQQIGAERFLARYILKSMAGGGSRTALAEETYLGPNPGDPVSNTRLTAQTGGVGAVGPAAEVQHPAALTAPILYAYFTPPNPPAFVHPLFKAQPVIWFDAAAAIGGVNGLRCYLIPSAADRAIAARIPIHAPGHPDFVFTTTQDGCTFRISGNFNSPILSHTNAYSSPAHNRAAALVNRLANMDVALGLAGVNPLDLTQNMAEFALLPTAASGSESQRDTSRRSLHQAHAAQQKVRQEATIGHKNFYWQVHQDTVNAINHQWKPSTSLIVGQFNAAQQVWEFFYQECGDVKIEEFQQRKLGSLVVKTTPQRTMTAGAIYVCGQFWPGIPTEVPFPS